MSCRDIWAALRQCFQTSSTCFVSPWSERQEDLDAGSHRGGFVLYSSPAQAEVPPQSFSPTWFWTALRPPCYIWGLPQDRREESKFISSFHFESPNTDCHIRKSARWAILTFCRVLHGENSVHWVRADTVIHRDRKLKPSALDVQH